MPFCEKCGQQISAESKFCPNCGVAIKTPYHSNERQRKQVYEGEVRKCPNCGEIVESFKHVCSSCGFEFRNSKSSNAIQEFAKEIARLETERNKITVSSKGFGGIIERFSSSKIANRAIDKSIASAIQSFPVPNTKEDILEFMILASSNIDTNALDKESNNYSIIAEAWVAKFEQTYKKAKIVFGDSTDFQKINEIYRQKRKKIRNGKLKSIWTIIITIGGLIGFFAFTFIFANISNSNYVANEEARLQAIVENIESDISNGNFKSALIRLNDLYYIPKYEKDNYDDYDAEIKALIQKWNTTQKLLINDITTAMGEELLELASPISSEQVYGKPYNSVVDLFEDSGFINVTTELSNEIPTSETANTVLEVSINGITSFSKNSKFPFNADVLILRYADFE